MSANNTLNALQQDVITQLPELFILTYSTLSAAVLLLYDYILTFPLEQRYIWHGKINVMKILFSLNRYSAIISQYASVLIYFVKPATDTQCQAFYYIYEIAGTIGVFAVTSIFILRTYAIYGRSWTIFFVLAVPGFLSTASSVWLTIGQTTFALPPGLQIGPNTCWFNESSSEFTASLVNYISVAVLDVFVVILTVCRTYRLALQNSREASVSTNLSFILLRDGMLYYGAIFIPQLAVMVMNVVVLRTDSNILDDVTEALNFVVAVLEVVLVNRLMLNLIHTANTDEDSEFRTRTGLEPPTFATGPFLGSIGGPFSTRPDYSEDDILDVEGDESIDADKFEGNALESTSANDTEDRYARAETGPSSTRVIEVERAQVF